MGPPAEAMGRRMAAQAASLQDKHRKASRDADTVSDEMYEEAKRLLGLFGVPYVEAPEEAEAQCAQLESAGLVDGVVTEDSDALLFGARVVYKHLFDPQHHVEVTVPALRLRRSRIYPARSSSRSALASFP